MRCKRSTIYAKSKGDFYLRVLSLFSGAGGLDWGFLEAGHDVVWANDFDHDSCKTYEKNIGC